MWLPKNQVGPEKYRTKQAIMKDIRYQVLNQVPYKVKMILLDGLNQSEKMMEYLDNNDLSFVMRCPKNRLIQLTENGFLKKLKSTQK